MGNIGKLAYRSSNGALVYKGGGGADAGQPVFKVEKPGGCTVQIDWRPKSWICQTYNVEHQNTFSCNGSFTTGSGNVSKTTSGTSVVFTLTNISASANFTVTFSNTSTCSTSEDPGVKANLVAAQSGAVPRMKTNVRCPMASEGSGTITVLFDANKKLSGVQ